MLEALPDTYQTENWLLDPEYYWEKKGVMEHTTLRNLVEPTSLLWIDGHSTYNGENDYMPLGEAEVLQDSLRFISVSEVNLRVFAPGKAFGNSKRRVQGQFRYAGTTYSLWVTDPNQERKWLAQVNGEHALGDCYLTISLVS